MKKANDEKKSQCFAEGRPKWKRLVKLTQSLAVAMILIYIVIRVVQYALEAAGGFLKWMTQTLAKMDAVVIVALITGTISILGIILSSIVAKALDYKRARREYLTQKREKPYGDFVEMIYKLQNIKKPGADYPESEMIDDLTSFSKMITLWGSPKVVNDWVKFKENTLDCNGIDKLLLTETIMNDMRKDLGMPRVKQGQLLAFFVNDIKDAIKNR